MHILSAMGIKKGVWAIACTPSAMAWEPFIHTEQNEPSCIILRASLKYCASLLLGSLLLPYRKIKKKKFHGQIHLGNAAFWISSWSFTVHPSILKEPRPKVKKHNLTKSRVSSYLFIWKILIEPLLCARPYFGVGIAMDRMDRAARLGLTSK